MPKGPRGQKRSTDVIGNAVHIMKIATGEIEEKLPKHGATGELGSKDGSKVRAAKLSKKNRS